MSEIVVNGNLKFEFKNFKAADKKEAFYALEKYQSITDNILIFWKNSIAFINNQ
jgi:hypothetical protein